MGVILFISIMMQVLRPRMEAEVAARSQLAAATYKLENESYNGRPPFFSPSPSAG